ncbi:MBL fold metallo-hydrolase [Lachnospiraceae bacterium 62-35]
MIRITTLIDNASTDNRALIHMHSLSFYVETDQACILFDFGSGKEFLVNAAKLGISPESASFCVCSHSHYDHAAGYRELLLKGITCPLITGEHFFDEKYTNDGTQRYTYLGCGFSAKELAEYRIPHLICRDILPFAPGCFAVGHFEKNYDFETIPSRFVKRTRDEMVPDSFEDEICLVLEHPKGLIVLVGCSHPGIVNILSSIQKRFHKKIQAVVGGTHLMKADETRTTRVIGELKKMDIPLLALNHCSGEQMDEWLKADGNVNGFHMGSGDCLFF